MINWYEEEVRWLEQTRRKIASVDAPPVVFYGSSSIRLWETLEEDFPGMGVMNLGFGGSTMAACAHFFRRLVPLHRPRSLLIYAGDNDLGDGRSPEDVLASLRDLFAVGEEDPFRESNQHLSATLWEKGARNALHVWSGRAHRASTWRHMAPLYI